MEITHKNQGELDSTMLPFVMRELVELVMKKKALPLGDALYYICLLYTSPSPRDRG